MPNSFYNHGSQPVYKSAGASSVMRAEFDAITAGFNKLPTLSAGVGRRLLAVNATGDAIETIFSGYRGAASAAQNALSTAFGQGVLAANTTGGTNSGFGYTALALNTTGNNQTAVGYAALASVTTGTGNTAIGASALQALVTGDGNVAIGTSALTVNTASNNTAVGANSLVSNTSGTGNTAIGQSALSTVTTTNFNTAIGTSAAANNTGSSQVAIGFQAMLAHTSGDNNIAIGRQAMLSGTAGAARNVAIGVEALRYSEANDNIGIGYLALNLVTSGIGNVAIGSNAGENYLNSGLVAIGFEAAKVTTGAGNSAIGYQALSANSTGTDNTVFGYQSGLSISTGNRNTALGASAMLLVAGGEDNTVIGFAALPAVVGGISNVAIGAYAFTSAEGISSNNVGVGWNVGSSLTTGSNNTLVGNSANCAATANNQTAIGDTATATKANQVMLGNSSVTEVATYGKYVTNPAIAAAYETAYGAAASKGMFAISNTAGEAAFGVAQFNNAATGPSQNFIKGRGTADAGVIVQNNDVLGGLYWYGVSSASALGLGASILAVVDGTPGAANDMPCRLTFSVSADGSATPTEAFRLASTGLATLRIGRAPQAGGEAMLIFGNVTGFGIYTGTGAPTVSAGQGSIYLRRDGSSTSTRMYVNTDGGTTWTAFTTAA